MHIEASRPLLYQIGGQPRLRTLVPAFYEKVLADGTLRHLFEDMDMEALQRKLITFLSFALGGGQVQAAMVVRIRNAHQPLRISSEQFDMVTEHLRMAMAEQDMDEALILKVLEAVESIKSLIVFRG